MREPLDLLLYLSSNAGAGVIAAFGILLTFFGFACVGRLCTPSAGALSALTGWAVVYATAVVAAIAGLTALPITLAIFAVGVAVSLFMRPPLRETAQIWPSAVVVAPLFVLGAFLPSLYWDSYFHWLPNALYLVETDRFPTVPIDTFPSAHPTYPAAIPLVIYIVSFVTRRFSEAAGLLTNVMLSLIAVEYFSRFLRRMSPEVLAARSNGWVGRLGLAAFTFTLLFLVNPSMQWVHYWSALADPVMAIVLLITLAVWCEILAPAGETRMAGASSRPVLDAHASANLSTLFVLGVLIGGIKHGSWQVAVVLVVAGVLVSMRRRIPARRFVPSAMAIVLGTIVSWALWQSYLSRYLPVQDEVAFVPLTEWRFDLLLPFLGAVWRDALAHWPYYGMLAAVLAFGVVTWIRPARQSSSLDLMIGVISLATLGHFACLLAAYLGIPFGEWAVLRAASLQRYSIHFGFAACAVGLVALAVAVAPRVLAYSDRLLRGPSGIGCGVAAFAILYAGLCAYPTLSYAAYFRTLADARAPAIEALELLPPGARAAVIGEDWSVLLARYSTWADFEADRRPALVSIELAWAGESLPTAERRLREWIGDSTIDHILLLDAPGLAAALNLPREPDHLWERASQRWRVIDLGR